MALLRYFASMSIAALQLRANETTFFAIMFVQLRIEKGFAVIGQIFPQNVMDVLIMFGAFTLGALEVTLVGDSERLELLEDIL